MARPLKNRNVTCKVTAAYFKPQGIPMRQLAAVALRHDELEALRLADFEGLYHADAARMMHISRQTFGNILKSARFKIADAMVNGKAVRIEKERADS